MGFFQSFLGFSVDANAAGCMRIVGGCIRVHYYLQLWLLEVVAGAASWFRLFCVFTQMFKMFPAVSFV